MIYMSNKIHCPVCGAENNDEYTYCITCGSKLPKYEKAAAERATRNDKGAAAENASAVGKEPAAEAPVAPETASETAPAAAAEAVPETAPEAGHAEPTSEGTAAASAAKDAASDTAPLAEEAAGEGTYGRTDTSAGAGNAEMIYGLPADEVAAFTGGRDSRLYRKLAKADKEGKSGGWNWPMFLFGVLLNMPFIWLYYRKMYKAANIVLAICLAANIAVAVLASSLVGCALRPMDRFLTNHPDIASGIEERVFEEADRYRYYQNDGLVPDDGTFDGSSLPGNDGITGGNDLKEDDYMFGHDLDAPLFTEQDAKAYGEEIVGYFVEELGNFVIFAGLLFLIMILEFIFEMVLAAKANSMYVKRMKKIDYEVRAVNSGMAPEAEIAKRGGRNIGLPIGLGIGFGILVMIIAEVATLVPFMDFAMRFIEPYINHFGAR